MQRLAWGAALALALAGCRGISLAEFDALHDQLAARTVLREPHFTL